MITLYRAQYEKPEFSTSPLEQELGELEKFRDGGPPGEYMVDAFQRMGKEKYLRLVELRKIIKDDQFFTDDQVQARFIAGMHQYLESLVVPEEIAEKHKVSPEEVLAVGGHPVENGNNYSFPGWEIAAHQEEWQVKVIDV